MNPFELIEFDGAISERQKSIVNLITERGSITRRECQKLLGLRQQYAQNYLFFLYKLGVLEREMGARRKATYFISGDVRDANWVFWPPLPKLSTSDYKYTPIVLQSDYISPCILSILCVPLQIVIPLFLSWLIIKGMLYYARFKLREPPLSKTG